MSLLTTGPTFSVKKRNQKCRGRLCSAFCTVFWLCHDSCAGGGLAEDSDAGLEKVPQGGQVCWNSISVTPAPSIHRTLPAPALSPHLICAHKCDQMTFFLEMPGAGFSPFHIQRHHGYTLIPSLPKAKQLRLPKSNF